MNKDMDINPVNTQNQPEKYDLNYSTVPNPKRSFKLTLVAILLIIAGIFALFNWSSIFLLDVNTIEPFVNQFKQVNPDMTATEVLNLLKTCGAIGCIISIFPILGGLLVYKKKMWGIALTCSMIGILSIGIMFTSSLLSFIAMILLIISRREFQ